MPGSDGFYTLNGFVSGRESDDLKPSFSNHATLRISSAVGLNFQEIGGTLGLAPTASGRRGERIGPRSPPNKADIWLFKAPIEPSAELQCHIEALWRAVKPHAEYLRNLKARASIDIHLGYSSNIDCAGIRVPSSSLEMFTVLELDFQLHIVVLEEDNQLSESE